MGSRINKYDADPAMAGLLASDGYNVPKGFRVRGRYDEKFMKILKKDAS